MNAFSKGWRYKLSLITVLMLLVALLGALLLARRQRESTPMESGHPAQGESRGPH